MGSGIPCSPDTKVRIFIGNPLLLPKFAVSIAASVVILQFLSARAFAPVPRNPRRLSSSGISYIFRSQDFSAGTRQGIRKTILLAGLRQSFTPASSDDNSLGSSSVSQFNPDKWDRMYEEGARSGTNVFDQIMKSGADPSSTPPGKQATPVRVVTFDLDNTLWKTGAVIGAANDALYEFMAETELNVPTRVELVMGELHKTNPGAYNPSLNEKKNDDNLREYEDGTAGQTTASTGAPVLLTQLRKDAVAQVCMEHNNFTPEEAEEYSQRAFDVWTNARHAAIPHHLAQDVVSSLQRLRDMKSSEGHPIVIGAITDGNSDPRNVPELKPIFDFCVNSENVGVSKPNAKVYLKAMELVLGGSYPVITESISNVASLDDGAGSWWVHVGDDFMKDIVAAKELRMRSIWATELIRDKLPEKNPVEKKPQENRDVGDFIKILASKPVVEMTIGTKDFLIEAVEEEFVDARAETFVDIVDTIVEWNKESSYVIDIDVSTVRADVQAETATEEVMVSLPSERENSQTKKSGVLKNKFCVFCGEKNPSVAKFCLACGEKQPDFP